MLKAFSMSLLGLVLLALLCGWCSASTANEPTPRGFVPTSSGVLAYRSAGSTASGDLPILAFHVSPFSSAEYSKALPSLSAGGRLVIAVDTTGFGFSPPQPQDFTLEALGTVVIEIADYFGLDEFAVVGSGFGVYVSLYAAALFPTRVKSVVVSNAYQFLPELVAAAEAGAVFDFDFFPSFELGEDGSHFLLLWNLRRPFVTDNRLLTTLTQFHMTYQLNGETSKQDLGVTQLIPELGPFVDWEFLSNNVQTPPLFLFGEDALALFDSFQLGATQQAPNTVSLFPDAQSMIVPGGSLWQFYELPEVMSNLVLNHISNPNRACRNGDKCSACAPRDCDRDSECQNGLLCADAHKNELRAAGLDPRTANCGGPPVVNGRAQNNWELCYKP